MSTNQLRQLATAALMLLPLCTASLAYASYADPSGRVARLNDARGDVSYSPAGEEEWVSVVRNRPLIRGDRLWTDRDARAELQLGSAFVRLGPDTSFEILDLSDRVAQLRLSQGSLNLRVRRMDPGQSYEVATPSLAFSIERIGRYRIDVAPDNGQTTIVVWQGSGEAYGENGSFPLVAGDSVRFFGNDLRDYEMYSMPRADEFDRYSMDRDQRMDRSISRRYVNDEVAGYADLDDYGSWRQVGGYGNTWFPNRVDAGWAPYRDGNWAWQEPWGWTWVDNQPWGFAPSHYGRWVNVSNRWGWIPGPSNTRPVYAPALVAFVGGRGWNASISLGGGSSIGWFPLGPREVYVPSYQASRNYFTQINVTNTVINNTTIINTYNNYASGNASITQVNYANRAIGDAVTVVPSDVFVNARPVRQAALRLDRNAVSGGEIMRVAAVTPSARSVLGPAAAARARPSREALDRGVFARNAPPERERPFAARESQLRNEPGRALEPRAEGAAPSQDTNVRSKVRVIARERGAVDVRAAGPRRTDGGARAPGQLKQLDRSANAVSGSAQDAASPEGSRDVREARQSAERAKQADTARQASDQQGAERQRQAETQQQEQRQRKADNDRQVVEQQNAERQRQAETQQQEQRQRKTDNDRQVVDQQNAERQRRVETQQQAQRERKSDNDRQVLEQQNAERQRQVETQQQEQRQRKADNDRQVVDQQNAERQRRVETQQQAQRERKSDNDRQVVEQQNAERQRQVEAQQQAQRERKTDSDRQVAEQPAQQPRADMPSQNCSKADKPTKKRTAKTKDDDKTKNDGDDPDADKDGE